MPLYHDIDCRDGKEKEENSGMEETITHTGVTDKIKGEQNMTYVTQKSQKDCVNQRKTQYREIGNVNE